MLADMCHTALGVNALFINPEERRTVNTNREEVWLREVVWVLARWDRFSQDSLVTVDWFHLCARSLCVINHWTLSMRPVLFPSNYFLMSHLSKNHSDRDWYCCKMSECAFLVTHGETKSQMLLNAQCIGKMTLVWHTLTEFHTFNCFVDKSRVEAAMNESQCYCSELFTKDQWGGGGGDLSTGKTSRRWIAGWAADNQPCTGTHTGGQ